MTEFIPDILQFLLFTWLFYLAGSLALIIGLIVSHIKKHAQQKIEYCTLIIPFIVWWILMTTDLMSKSLSNLIESFYIGIAVSVLYLLRLAFSKSIKHPAQLLLAASCLVSILIYFLIPTFPE